MGEIVELKWKRPESLVYPKVWVTFEAKDTNSDQLVEYRIEDLPESRLEEAMSIMAEHFCRDAPFWEAYELINDDDATENLRLTWRSVIAQKMALVCLKNGSNEIVGLNLNCVSSKDDQFMAAISRQCRSEGADKVYKIVQLLYGNFDAFEHYGVDKYLGSMGLLVTPRYRGRSIGEHFLKVRRDICKEFGLKLTSTLFTSNFSNRLADKVGFQLDVSLSIDEIRSKHPEFELPPTKSDALTIKSIVY